MSMEQMSCRHVLDLKAGERGEIEFRYPATARKSFGVRVSAIHFTEQSGELVFEDMGYRYDMRRFISEDDRWERIVSDEEGDLRASVRFGAGYHLNVSADLAVIHSLDLIDVAAFGQALRLTFRESGESGRP